jgi:hypothetical protein
MPKDAGAQYGKREAKRRFDQALRGALNTPPQPLKSRQDRGKEPLRVNVARPTKLDGRMGKSNKKHQRD